MLNAKRKKKPRKRKESSAEERREKEACLVNIEGKENSRKREEREVDVQFFSSHNGMEKKGGNNHLYGVSKNQES